MPTANIISEVVSDRTRIRRVYLLRVCARVSTVRLPRARNEYIRHASVASEHHTSLTFLRNRARHTDPCQNDDNNNNQDGFACVVNTTVVFFVARQICRPADVFERISRRFRFFREFPSPSFPSPVSKLNKKRVLRHITKLTTGATVATTAASKCLHRNINSCRLIGRQSTCSRHRPVTYREVYFKEVGLQPTQELIGEITCLVSHHSCKNGVQHHWRITQ